MQFESDSERIEYNTLFYYGCDLTNHEQYAEAMSIFRRLERYWPDAPGVLGWLGVLHRRLGLLEVAIEYLRRATQVSSGSDLASLCLFHAFQEADNLVEALEEMDRFENYIGHSSEEYYFVRKELRGDFDEEESRKHLEERTRRLREQGQ